MKLSITITFALLLFPSLLSAQSDITEHLQTVEAHLRAADVSELSAAEQDARNKTLDNLRRYHQRGEYPKNKNFADARVPYFVDDEGTNCAVAELMVNSGYDAEVKKIAASENNHWLHEMSSPDLARWTKAAGISIQEAAWIQPTYEFCVDTSFIEPPASAKCGDTVELRVKEVECESTTFTWSLLRNEKPVTSEFEANSTTQTYEIPNPTSDGERFTFKVKTDYEDGVESETSHTLVVECEGQEPAPPVEELPIFEDMSGPDMGTSDVGNQPDPTSDSGSTSGGDKADAGCSSAGSSNETGLIFGLLFLFGVGRKKRRHSSNS